MLLLVILK